jgi:hypothetical protein
MVEVIRELCDIAWTEGDPVCASVPMLGFVDVTTTYERRVWRRGRWREFASGDNPVGRVRAGEIVIEYTEGAPVTTAYLITGEVACGYIRLEARQTESGTVKIDLPDGRVIERPDPRD